MNPTNLRYTKEHEWARLEADGTATIGITQHAQDALGDIVFASLPKVGATLKAGEGFGAVESVKSVSDLFAPCSGRVVEVNSALVKAPEIINSAPYGDGWICRIELADASELDGLMDAEAYAAFVAAEAH